MTKYEPNIWYGWNGGACPVHHKTLVEVQFDNYRGFDYSEHWEWNHHSEGVGSDIIAFRIIKEHKEPREIWVKCLGYTWVHCEHDTKGAVLFREVVE